MKCIHCGREISDGSLFCTYCGKEIKQENNDKSMGQRSDNYAKIRSRRVGVILLSAAFMVSVALNIFQHIKSGKDDSMYNAEIAALEELQTASSEQSAKFEQNSVVLQEQVAQLSEEVMEQNYDIAALEAQNMCLQSENEELKELIAENSTAVEIYKEIKDFIVLTNEGRSSDEYDRRDNFYSNTNVVILPKGESSEIIITCIGGVPHCSCDDEVVGVEWLSSNGNEYPIKITGKSEGVEQIAFSGGGVFSVLVIVLNG